MSETRTYRGLISEHTAGENDCALFLSGVHEPLAKAVRDDIDALGEYLSVRYFISDTEKTIEDLEDGLIEHLEGVGDAVYTDRGSEITGYLWTDEWLNVGGHALLDEIQSYVGKWCHLEISYSKDAR